MKKILLLLFIIFFITALYSAKSYTVMSRGIVRDNSTGLLWTRCPLAEGGKPIYDFQCNGTKKYYTWAEAVTVCDNLVHERRADWRLPTIKELQSIIYYYHYSTGSQSFSQVVESVFPNTILANDLSNLCSTEYCPKHYWASTEYYSNTTRAWIVSFDSGTILNDTKTNYKYVRCVAGP